MSVAFWSTKLTANKPVKVQPPEGYILNIQQAVLVDGKDKVAYRVKVDTVAIEGEPLESVIAVLRSGVHDQSPLNLVFGYDVETTFTVLGDNAGAVYLSGELQLPHTNTSCLPSLINVI